jgi:outer membrane protein OmpA-like peptidoglycan-associated protein
LISKNKIFARLIAKGHGESRPIAPNVSNECRASNRRVEINRTHQAASIEPMLVNWSQVSARRNSDLIKLVASDTVYVKREPVKLPSLAGVNFYSGSANLTPEAKKILDNAAATLRRLLQRDADALIEIAGHTDDVGSDESNLRLSQARAESVKNYFIDKCIPPDRMRTVGYGERNPIDANTTPQGRARNRRVELQTIKMRST